MDGHGPLRDDLDIPMPRMAPAEPGYRVSRAREPVDATTKRLALFGGAIALVLVGVVGIGALTGHRGGGGQTPVVQADSRPLRTKPANPGGMQLDGQDDSILSGDAGGKDELIPPPEQPAPQALRAEAAQPNSSPTMASGGQQPKAGDGTGRPASPEPAASAAGTPPVSTAPSGPARPAEASAPTPAAAASSSTKSAVQPTSGTEADTKPVVLSQLGGHAAVQLAALTSEQAALSEWHRLSRKMPSLLDGRQPSVQRYEHGGRTFYRLRTGGFADIAQATAFCQQVRAAGGGCSLASF